jgi:hypothetical protein
MRAAGPEQPVTWVTVLTGDMGNTFPVLFMSSVAVVGPVGLWLTRQGYPQVHRPGVWTLSGGLRLLTHDQTPPSLANFSEFAPRNQTRYSHAELRTRSDEQRFSGPSLLTSLAFGESALSLE